MNKRGLSFIRIIVFLIILIIIFLLIIIFINIKPDICKKETDQSKKDYCYSNLGINTNNIKYCEMVNNSDEYGYREACIMNIAIDKEDLSLCEKINYKDISPMMGGETYSREICRNFVYEKLAISKNNVSYCRLINENLIYHQSTIMQEYATSNFKINKEKCLSNFGYHIYECADLRKAFDEKIDQLKTSEDCDFSFNNSHITTSYFNNTFVGGKLILITKLKDNNGHNYFILTFEGQEKLGNINVYEGNVDPPKINHFYMFDLNYDCRFLFKSYLGARPYEFDELTYCD